MGRQQSDDDTAFSRRTFMKASGAVAGTSALGLGGAGTAAAVDGPIDERLLNWRAVEARRVWERGFRGRPDRSLAVIDTGISARHPDLGPWNEVLAGIEDGKFKLADAEGKEYPDPSKEKEVTNLATLDGSGTIGPGATDAGVVMRETIVEFTPSEVHDTDKRANQFDATLTWTPQEQDNELVLDRFDEAAEEWVEVTRSTDFNPLTGQGERITINVDDIQGGDVDTLYRFVIETYANAAAQYELVADINNLFIPDLADPEFDFKDPSEVEVFDFLDEDDDGPQPKTIGWFNETSRFGDYERPRDPDGHGSHCAGIMTGTGRASTIDYDNTEVEKPRAILLPGDFVEYDIDGVPATSTVFVSALGDNVKLELLFDGEIVHESTVRADSIIVDEPAVHDSGKGSYTVRVRPLESRAAAPVAEDAQAGNPTVGRLNEIAFGSYLPPADVTGAARTASGPQSVHPGVAPNMSLVGLSGYGSPTEDLAEYADEFADAFNLRAANMSFGYPYGIPFGAFGGQTDTLPAAIKGIAEGGILSVAAAGNFMTPANGNGSPAGMDEAISVVATGPFDGLTPYTAGGIGTIDEDENDFDRKPDVTAPGGDIDDYAVLLATAVTGLPYPVPSYYELVRAVKNADPDTAFSDADPPRDYTEKGGTSMAAPYTCGAAGLVAEAMEFEAPDSIALPEPADTGFDDVMRFKQVLLVTASETAFTAAPYHAAKSPPHAPVYTHGGRDPYEGFGRVNPDAAVDAVSRNLFGDEVFPALGDDDYSETYRESVGTYVPEDARAVAGFVTVPGGDLEASIEFTDYSGGNAGMAKDSPHLDLFVYDAESPAQNGEPNIVASDQGEQGSASVSVSVDRGTRNDPNERTFYVVAKIVNIPGVVNGYDVQANFDFGVSFDPAEAFAPTEVDLNPEGSRATDSSVYTGGQTKRIEVTISDFNEDLTDEVTVTDSFDSNWTFVGFGGDFAEENQEQATVDEDAGTVEFVNVTTTDLDENDGSVTFRYFVEAPEGPGETGQYTFGPAEAEAVDPNDFEDDPNREQGQTNEEFTGSNTATLVGQGT